MSRSEFRWNKRRKHYAYLHKDKGHKRYNILITSKPLVIEKKNKKKKRIIKNVPLFHHPNNEKEGQFYVIPKNYLDDSESFDEKKYSWKWNKNDKRKIKRIKKNKKTSYETR